MAERSITRAAKRIGLSQPAVSASLARLRDLLGDELFIRVPGGVRPTPRALELALPVRNVLVQLQSVLRPAKFSPATVNQTFTLAVSDQCSILLLPTLLKRLRKNAPGLQIRTRPKTDALVAAQLRSGEIDLAIGTMSSSPLPQISQLTLFRESYVCAVRASHPLAVGQLTFERFMAAQHLVVTHAGEAVQLLDHELFKMGHERRIAMTINQSLLAPMILESSDLVLTSYRLLTALPFFSRLVLKELPFDVPPLDVKLLWHNQFTHHPAHEWLRGQIEAISNDIARTAAARGIRLRHKSNK